MARRRRFSSNTVRTVGSLLPPDVLAKAVAGDGLEGLALEDYGLAADMRMRDAVNDAWNEAKALWWRFRSELRDLPEDDTTATSLTRERWVTPLLGLLGFEGVEVVKGSIVVGGTEYAVSHMWHSSPIHVMGAKVDIDGRAVGVRGAARLSPHSTVQQFLNRSDEHLWGIVTNGYRLRILRDSVSLTRQAFVEFDLEAMLNGEVFVDFLLLYRVAHATRFVGERPEDCFLERWIAAARDEGIRVLDQLREGVESALTTLGTGFLRHPDNVALRAQVDAGDLDARDLYRYLLRLVYRLLFLFVAEDRDLLLLPDADPAVRDRYDRYYSTARLRELASRPAGSGHEDLWAGLTSLMQVLGRDEGEPALGLPGLGSFLWAHDSIDQLAESSLDNEDLLDTLQGLAYVDEGGALRRIDFASMGAEELGSVYESLLELHPSVGDDRDFVLDGGAGSERKTTGSYYTPTELIVELLDSALDPVLEEAASKDDPEKAILDLKIVDPAVGSGHFLVAAAHRVAKRLAEVRTGEPEPPEADYRHAVRDVVSRCLFAVDVNDLAVELCKVSLWLEALEPGKPLSFLDHHILVGNSLFGATPSAIADGIPDDAFQVLTGDDKKTVSELKKRNRKERSGQDGLPFDAADGLTSLGSEIQTLEDFDDEDLETVRAKERILADWKTSPAYQQAKLVADTWCAAFAIEKTPDALALTDSMFRRLRDEGRISPVVQGRVERLAQRYAFFHWHLAFPQVFGNQESDGKNAGSSGGFDAVLGNPPWETVELAEKEFFSGRKADIAEASTAALRKSRIRALETDDPELHNLYVREKRYVDAQRTFLRVSGVYPTSGTGRINLFAPFAELTWRLIGSGGRVGIIVPSGIATDHTTRHLFGAFVRGSAIRSFYEFENEGFFDIGRGHMNRFALVTLSSDGAISAPGRYMFRGRRVSELRDPTRVLELDLADFVLLNPNTLTCPVFAARRDYEITRGIYERWPVLLSEVSGAQNEWDARFKQGLLNITTDSALLKPAEDLLAANCERIGNRFVGAEEWLPVYEAKMFHQLNHRYGDYDLLSPGSRGHVLPRPSDEQLATPSYVPQPRYWFGAAQADDRLPDDWDEEWLFGWRDVTDSRASARTMIASFLPRSAPEGGVLLLFAPPTVRHLLPLLALDLNSMAYDYLARQKVGGNHLKFFTIKQIPVIPPSTYEEDAPWGGSLLKEWLLPRLTELAYTSTDMTPLARVMGYEGPPVRWDGARRQEIMAEIDASYLHLYGYTFEDASYILDSFPVVRRNDMADHGSYRTKELILDVYDRMAKAIETGEPYETILDPPPADSSLRVDVEAVE